MAPLHRLDIVLIHEMVPGVLPHRFQEPEARCIVQYHRFDQRLLNQRHQERKTVGPFDPTAATHALYRLQIKATGKDCEPAQRAVVPRPSDARSSNPVLHAGFPAWARSGCRCRAPAAIVQQALDLGAVTSADLRRSQLDGQGKTFQSPADPRHRS